MFNTEPSINNDINGNVILLIAAVLVLISFILFSSELKENIMLYGFESDGLDSGSEDYYLGGRETGNQTAKNGAVHTAPIMGRNAGYYDAFNAPEATYSIE